MSNEGKTDLVQTVSDTVQNLGELAAAQITAVDKGIQNLQPAIDNLNTSLTGTLETGAKTATDTMNSLSEPLNSLIKTCGDIAVKGVETIGGAGWKLAETVGAIGNTVLSTAQSILGTAGNLITSVLPIGKKI